MFLRLCLPFRASISSIPRRFWNRQPTRESLLTPQEKKVEYNPYQALQLMRLHTFTSFEETVDLCVRINVNPKHGDQMVRGSAEMPSGLGKSVKVAVLCSADEWPAMKDAGADLHVTQAVLKEIGIGQTNFEILFTTPGELTKLKAFGKTLGPRGLMPNVKVGTLVPADELAGAIRTAKRGKVTFRVDNGKNIHVPLGKYSFEDEALLMNMKSVLQQLNDLRPTGLKGKYFTQAYLKTTMGPRWKLNVVQIDPKNQRGFWACISSELETYASK